jgi:hypothetical protein
MLVVLRHGIRRWVDIHGLLTLAHFACIDADAEPVTDRSHGFAASVCSTCRLALQNHAFSRGG